MAASLLCFSQTNQTRTAENSTVESFYRAKEVSLRCLFGRACDRVPLPFLREVCRNVTTGVFLLLLQSEQWLCVCVRSYAA